MDFFQHLPFVGNGHNGHDLLSEQEAFVGIAMSALAPDGELRDGATESLASAFRGMALFDGMSSRRIRSLIARVAARGRTLGMAELMRECAAALPPRLGAPAYAIAIDLVRERPARRTEDEWFLGEMREALGLEPTLAAQIEMLVDAVRGAPTVR